MGFHTGAGHLCKIIAKMLIPNLSLCSESRDRPGHSPLWLCCTCELSIQDLARATTFEQLRSPGGRCCIQHSSFLLLLNSLGMEWERKDEQQRCSLPELWNCMKGWLWPDSKWTRWWAQSSFHMHRTAKMRSLHPPCLHPQPCGSTPLGSARSHSVQSPMWV